MSALWEGMLAGYGIAIPIGAISVLILETSIRRGFLFGFVAGAGAAMADTVYALIASIAGIVVASALSPYAGTLKMISGIILLSIGFYGLRQALKRGKSEIHGSGEVASRGHKRTFWQFLGLTLLNPLTVVYFTALIMNRETSFAPSPMEQLTFVFGAGLASLSWQTLLATVGQFARKILSQRVQMMVSVLGYLIVVGLGLRILLTPKA